MVAKTATIMARVEPEIKEQAEHIMSELGIPASVVINMLYKQIVMTRSIPFSMSVPVSRDEMDQNAFNGMMQKGLDDAKANRSRPVADVCRDLRREHGK